MANLQLKVVPQPTAKEEKPSPPVTTDKILIPEGEHEKYLAAAGRVRRTDETPPDALK